MSFSFDRFYFDLPASDPEYLPELTRALARELRDLVPEQFRAPYKDLLDRTRQAIGWFDPEKPDDGQDELLDIQDELMQAIAENAPPYLVLELSNTGKWEWRIDRWAVEHSEALKVEDLSEVDEDYRGEVFVVNDHGNISLYVKDDTGFNEIWSAV